jgi:hypothetical protein
MGVTQEQQQGAYRVKNFDSSKRSRQLRLRGHRRYLVIEISVAFCDEAFCLE